VRPSVRRSVRPSVRPSVRAFVHANPRARERLFMNFVRGFLAENFRSSYFIKKSGPHLSEWRLLRSEGAEKIETYCTVSSLSRWYGCRYNSTVGNAFPNLFYLMMTVHSKQSTVRDLRCRATANRRYESDWPYFYYTARFKI